MLADAVAHMLNNVLPASQDYDDAEDELSAAFEKDNAPDSWREQGLRAKRRASEVAIAIDGLADRAAIELDMMPDQVRAIVASLCSIDDYLREGSIERICAVANAYKHSGPLRPKHPIVSESDVLATGAGYGIDGFGIGKMGGVEVLVHQRDGTIRKFLGDVPWSIAGWFQFLALRGAILPPHAVKVCGMSVYRGTAS